MKFYNILLILFFSCGLALAQNNKTLSVYHFQETIKIDGVVDTFWDLADSTADFVQFSPFNNVKPSRKTVVKVLSNDEALYCLFICYEEKDKIERKSGTQDDFTGDIVSFMLDTFNDKKTAYKFAVNASGVRADSRLLDDARNRDYSWDGIWKAESRIYDWGYVIEIEIPYKSIQYDENLTEWGLDFDRWIPHLNEDIYWCSYSQNEGQRISKFGKLVFHNFKPSVKGMNFEIYPVAITKATKLSGNKYKFEPDAGIDIFYNPSPKVTLQFTANPDFAQIEADPFSFNISRYESYFSEKRPFFTEGNEIFMASGRQNNSGFYRPLELFYSRRIGKVLPDGSAVQLQAGSKVFGRIDDWEYGAFIAKTAETDYSIRNNEFTEPSALYSSFRIKKQLFENSSIGILYAGKQTASGIDGVLDIDGAFRRSDLQLSYQIARSINNGKGDYAFSTGLNHSTENFLVLFRSRYIGADFDINQVGFVPWKGNVNGVFIAGPIWFFDSGNIQQVLIYGGPAVDWTKEDDFIDRTVVLGLNLNFRNNWGFEINSEYGKSKEINSIYNNYRFTLSSWFNTSTKWSGNLNAGYEKAYNFYRRYLSHNYWTSFSLNIKPVNFLSFGTSFSGWIEETPTGGLEDITINARPYISFAPVNDLKMRVYVDNIYTHSTNQVERILVGFLFSYNFSPKSWIYFAFNEAHQRSGDFNNAGNISGYTMKLSQRAAVLKIKYLYYF